MTSVTEAHRWWKEGVCYQVWPLSFKDSTGDGHGDIRGLINKLDYLRDLGVDYIWLSPMYASPRNDYGYDISDYESVDPTFGTLEDMDDLIAELKARGMRLILDLVVNHTSHLHRWFIESSKSKDNEFSNYYMWRDPKIVDGKKCPPNNWKCFIGDVSAWTYVEARDQYYLHWFPDFQPDLNWEDPLVRKAIYKSAIEFWLDRGVAGFRVDVVNLYSKDTTWADAPITDPNSEFQRPPFDKVINGPRMHEFLQEQRRESLNKYGESVFLVGELGGTDAKGISRYLSPVERELDTIFDFDIFLAGGAHFEQPLESWEDNNNLLHLRKALIKSQSFISEYGVWPTTYFENHDRARSIPAFGSRQAQHRWQCGRLLALMLASMSGSLFVYQGQEIGMDNVSTSWEKSDFKDPFLLKAMEEAERKYPVGHPMREKAWYNFCRCNRDNSRTPVQWSSEEPCAGFSTGKPWIRVIEDFREGVNVEAELKDPESLLNYWRQLLKFRKTRTETMIYGHAKFIDQDNEHVLSVVKEDKSGAGAKDLLVVLNYSDDTQPFPVESELNAGRFKYLFGTGPEPVGLELHPWEGRVYEAVDTP